MRYASGAGVRWQSPLGPIRIEFGVPSIRRRTTRRPSCSSRSAPAVGATIDRHFTRSKEIILMRRFILTMAQLSMMLALVLPALPASGLPTSRSGIVDLQRALNESSSGKKAKDQFKGEFEKMQNGLKAEKDSLDA
jgi:hypothetical protein